MKITIRSYEDEYEGYSQVMKIDNDNKQRTINVFPLCECPEDAIIGRSLISCDEIASLMKIAYQAGVDGKDFNIDNIKVDDRDNLFDD